MAYVLLVATALFLAGNHTIGRAVRDQIPPLGLSFWRWVVGILILAPFALPGVIRHKQLIRKNLGTIALLGFFMIGSTTLVLVALGHTMAINVSLINAIQPTLTVFFAWLLYQQPLHGWRSVGVACGLAGVVIMVSRGNLEVLTGFQYSSGDLIALLAMCGFAGYALNLRKLPDEMGAVVPLFVITIVGTIMLLPFYLWESITVKPVPVTTISIAAIVALALLVSVLGNLCWYRGNRIIGPTRASIFINLIPVFGTALAIMFLHEQIQSYQLVGGGLVILGLALAAGAGKPRTGINS